MPLSIEYAKPEPSENWKLWYKELLFWKITRYHFWLQIKIQQHIEYICKEATRKLNALSRIVPYMDISRWKTLMNAFFRSQFNYRSLIWMCYNRSLNHKTNRLHERYLRIIYGDRKSGFGELLDMD